MANDQDQASKTEDATPRKLEEARKKGDVAKSADIAPWLSLAATFGVVAVAGGWMMKGIAASLLPFVARPEQIRMDGAGGVFVLREAAMAAAPALAAIMLAGAVAGVFGNVLQHGLLWSPDKVKPDLKKVSPLSGFKRIFGVDGQFQFLKSFLKIVTVGVITWLAFKPHVAMLASLAALDPAAMLPVAGDLLRSLFFAVLAFLGVTAGVDFMWQRHRFNHRMKMSRHELKDDYKQSEGDPQVKARQRQLRMERAKRRMMQNVPNATVVVMNPTHYAVALRYEAGETAAPECVAKGLDTLALKIREVAEAAGVPIIEDPPLARALYAAVEVDETIPPAHYEAVAKVIGFILSGARAKRAAARPMR